MLLDESPSSLMAACIENLTTTQDKACLHRSRNALAHLSSTRTRQLQKQKTDLSTLSRNLSQLQSTHQLTLQSHNPLSHANDIHRLDTEKFRIAKEASDLEIEGERLGKEIVSAKRAIDELGDDDGEGGVSGREVNAANEEILLKLKVYRMLGIDVEPEPETGVYSKAVVRNRAKGDVCVVNIDPKFSRYFYANYFWNVL